MIRILLLSLVLLGTAVEAQKKIGKEDVVLIKSGKSTEPMRVLQITNPKDLKILKDVSRPVDVKDPNLKLLAERMLATVKDEQGVGIAAPQVGLNIKAIWVQRFDKEGKPFEFFVNPEIKWMSSALRLGAEGCLSIPNERGEVYRSLVIDLAYETLDGEKKRELVEGFTAVIFQHEYDHLIGRLFTERIKEQKLGTFIYNRQNQMCKKFQVWFPISGWKKSVKNNKI